MLEGTHFLLFEHQMPQNMLIQTPEQKPAPFFFSLRLTLNRKLTAGQEITPASHNCPPVHDCLGLSRTPSLQPGLSLCPQQPSHRTDVAGLQVPAAKITGMGAVVKPENQWWWLAWWGQGRSAPRAPAVGTPLGCSAQGLPFHASPQTGTDTLVRETSRLTGE